MSDTPEPRRLSDEPLIPVFFFVAAIVLVILRLQAFDLPLETDEANYAYIGGRLLHGDRLYVDIWDHQPFGVYLLTAGLMELFGDSAHVFRWSAVAASLVSLACVMGILRRVCSVRASLVGGLLFAVVSIDPGSGGEGCNREIYMNALILAGWGLALAQRHRAAALVVAGVCLGLASTFKTIVAVHWGLLAIYVLAFDRESFGTRGSGVGARVRGLACLAVGPIAVWTAAIAYFAATDRVEEFIDAVFLFNLGYAGSGEPFWMRVLRFFAPIRHRFVFESALPLWILAAVSTAGVAVSAFRRPWSSPRFVLVLMVSGYLAICLPGRFWPHYYYLLIPSSVIIVAYCAEAVARSLTAPLGTIRGAKALLGLAIVCLAPLLTGVWETRHFLLQSDFGKTVKRYNSRDFWGRGQGLKVASVTDPTDSIFVWGNDASIYYYSGRKCASRYTMITGLMTGMRGADHRRKILLDELRASPPRLIVVLFDEPPFAEWKAYLEEFYTDPVGWDLHDTTREPIMFVVARKDAPIAAIDWDWDRSSVGGWDPNRPLALEADQDRR